MCPDREACRPPAVVTGIVKGDETARGDGVKIRKAVIPAAGLGTRFLPASKAQPFRKGGMAPSQRLGMPDQEPPPPAPDLRQVKGQHEQTQRDHPEAENGQETEKSTSDQHQPERQSSEATGGKRDALLADANSGHGLTK